MPIPLNQALIEEFEKLLRNKGIRDVSRWILPNDDVPFDEAVALEAYEASLDEEFKASQEFMGDVAASEAATEASNLNKSGSDSV